MGTWNKKLVVYSLHMRVNYSLRPEIYCTLASAVLFSECIVFFSQQISISISISQISARRGPIRVTKIWLMLMLMLICYERKTLCVH